MNTINGDRSAIDALTEYQKISKGIASQPAFTATKSLSSINKFDSLNKLNDSFKFTVLPGNDLNKRKVMAMQKEFNGVTSAFASSPTKHVNKATVQLQTGNSFNQVILSGWLF